DDAAAWSDAPPAKLALFDVGREDVGRKSEAPSDVVTKQQSADNATLCVGVEATPPGTPRPPPCGDIRPTNLTPLLNYVDCQDAQVLPAMRDWLTHVYAVADVAEAYALRSQLPPGGWFVTKQGHLVGARSVLFHAPDSQLHGVLARQREIEKLEQELEEQNRGVEFTREQVAQAEQKHQSIESQIGPLRTAGNELQQRLHTLQMQILKLNQAHERTAERAAQIEQEMQELAEQMMGEQGQQSEADEQMALLREQIFEFHAQVEDAQRQVNTLDLTLRDQRSRAQQAQHALQEARFFAKTCVEKIADLQHNTEQLAESLAQFELNLGQLNEDLTGSEDEAVQQQLQAALDGRQAYEQALAEARNILENATVELQKLEQERLSCEHKLDPLREKLNELALKEQEARLHFEQWAEQLQGVDEQALQPLLDAGNNKPNTLQNELNRLAADIEALGAVNLAALEELQASTERKAYLDAQALDLNEAMATLEDAIRRIDKESRDLLMDTYNKVNQHLSELFPVLFAGGEARLVLTGEEILDSGVQVMAQPPGKKNSSIHLMSGGEKALTAIALVFSLFQLNPAPFCLLDEVDAPLDDTNTERLCALIQRMSLQTQFIFISHNKITMEMAKQLVGVTMQEKGVSKVVAVDMEEALRMRDEQVVA
ncbi:MAG TPA: chromosome segregation protein SMC, partial [Gallionellaceae bacterium]|nr:chromosome segregation protein SMC [Gallionellaceae bacterium]